MYSQIKTLASALRHHEGNPSWRRLRHPVVVLCHVPFVMILAAIYVLLAEGTPGQRVYFAVTIGLYISSTMYHAVRPSEILRFADQTMIAWYIIAAPLPFLYDRKEVVAIAIMLMIATAVHKWRERSDPNWRLGAYVFLALGVWSTLLVLLLGLPAIGASLFGSESRLMIIAICCFVAKLMIYRYKKLKLVEDYWESEESGHCALALGVTITSYVVATHPVWPI